MTRASTNRPLHRWEICRDVTSFILGWGLVFQQALGVPPGDVNEAFLALAANLILGPGVVQAYTARNSRNGTGARSSRSARPQSRLPRSSSPSGTEGEE